MDDFTPYITLRNQGASTQAVYQAARANGLDFIASLRMLRHVFGLSLVKAKEVTVQADYGVASLSEYQERFIPMVEAVAREDEEEEGREAGARGKEEEGTDGDAS
jgi:hypothetical protein